MTELKLDVEKRTLLGRKIKRLRKQGILPANIFGKKIKSESIQVDYKTFLKIFGKAGETNVVYLKLDKKEIPVLIHNIQKDPVSGNFVHTDFLHIDLTQKVTTNVPIELEGESEAEKLGLGTVVQYIQEVEVEALPTDLPDVIKADISVLKTLEDIIFVKDLKVSSKVEIKNDPEQILAKIEEAQKEEEPTPVPVEGEGVEGVEEKKEEGSENPSEEAKKE